MEVSLSLSDSSSPLLGCTSNAVFSPPWEPDAVLGSACRQEASLPLRRRAERRQSPVGTCGGCQNRPRCGSAATWKDSAQQERQDPHRRAKHRGARAGQVLQGSGEVCSGSWTTPLSAPLQPRKLEESEGRGGSRA